MRYFLLRIKLNGIKSIDKEIQIDFYKSSLSRKFNPKTSHVKAIYGPNGAGKTGIIYAIDIYKNLLLNSEYLTLCNATGSLNELVNKKSEKFSIEMYYGILNKEETLVSVYRHKIVLSKVNNRYVISEEKLSKLIGSRMNIEEKYKTVFYVKNSELLELENISLKEEIKQVSMNLLDKQCLSSILLSYVAHNKGIDVDKKFYGQLFHCIFFALNITVVLQDTDTNYVDLSFINNQIDAIMEEKNRFKNEDLFYNSLVHNQIVKRTTRQIEKNKIEAFEKNINKLERFIKVFKDDLETIVINKDENGDIYECELILVYKNGKRINEKYESTGIKKIIKLYSSLCNIEKGQIVFIDEFDANIHDVLLMKLVEYIMSYSKGQLIFTTHNLAPMEILKKAQHSIDFLSPDSRIATWTKSGNYAPDSMYRKGLIEYSPFNIEPFNFIGVLGDNK